MGVALKSGQNEGRFYENTVCDVLISLELADMKFSRWNKTSIQWIPDSQIYVSSKNKTSITMDPA